MSYALFVDERYEAWLEPYDTLEDARAAYEAAKGTVDQWRPRVALVQILEDHDHDS